MFSGWELCWWWWWGWLGWMYMIEMSVIWVLMFRLASAVKSNNGTTAVRSWNVTRFLGFGLGSWKESTLSRLVRYLLFGLWRVLKWWSVVTQGLHSELGFSCTFCRSALLIIYERPHSKISVTVPVNHLIFCTVLLLQKELNFFSHFQDSLILSLVSLVKMFFLCLLDF